MIECDGGRWGTNAVNVMRNTMEYQKEKRDVVGIVYGVVAFCCC